MAYKQPKAKEVRLGEFKISKKKFKALPEWKKKFLIKFPPKTSDIIQRVRYFYALPEMERKKGTLVRFGAGEEKLGVITKSQDNGVWVRELVDTGEEGLLPDFKYGKEFFVKRGRFEKHLGEKGAVGLDEVQLIRFVA
jgi:hypothetical protein